MKILVVGGGGREHAFAWKLATSEIVEKVYVAPGNAGTAFEHKVENIEISSENIEALARFAINKNIHLTVVGPETALASGIVDRFEVDGLHCFGPRQNAARLESSKVFAKEFLERHSIPTAQYRIFDKATTAINHIEKMGIPLVIKADGLAAGKGVVVAHSLNEAIRTIHQILDEHRFGAAGNRLVIEKFLPGEEASFICIVSNGQVLPLATSQDHKRRDAGDSGPNTGGMGAYSPAPVISRAVYKQVMQKVIGPTIKGLVEDGISYTGFLYVGLMIDQTGNPRVLEYNCRSGDPETQPILLRLQTDLADLCMAAMAGELHRVEIDWDNRTTLGVVMAARGYPDHYPKGEIIEGIHDAETDGVKVFHAGTAIENGNIITSGGRVLCVTALGDNVIQAQAAAYRSVRRIRWPNAYYRPDIGYHAIARANT